MKHAEGGQESSLYLHFPCFDGVVSAVIAAEFLERRLGWTISRYVPVEYDRAPSWRTEPIGSRSAVVDFLYHPQAFFWADHHATSFQEPRDRAALDGASNRYLYYDATCPSCSILLWRNLGASLGDSPRLAEMVSWADKIDSAAYASVNEAIFGGSPAMEISFSLAIDKSERYCNFLVHALREQTLGEVARLPEVREPAQSFKDKIGIGLDAVKRDLHIGGAIVRCDVEEPSGGIISRYSPYYFAPDARYSVMLVRSAGGAKVTAMRNPWLDFESVEIGKLMEQFGGGGHRRVGSVQLKGGRVNEAAQIQEQIAAQIENLDAIDAAAEASPA
ncbi:MAG TPA: hypothetical protein VHT92_05795 [Candidatus Cybelea sp.]|jgi:hypothetical protein|nr:hypothetical protein [Candidatus Cybelea sp.]